ncbi:MAG: hypothetical protein U0325_12540 [Polyangiales bacterium]
MLPPPLLRPTTGVSASGEQTADACAAALNAQRGARAAVARRGRLRAALPCGAEAAA